MRVTAQAPAAPAAPGRACRAACPYGRPPATPEHRLGSGSCAQRRQYAAQGRGTDRRGNAHRSPVRQHDLDAVVRLVFHRGRAGAEWRARRRAAPASSDTTCSGRKAGVSATSLPRRCASRHCQSKPRLTSCRRATSLNLAPGSFSSARIRSFSSSRHCRRRSTPVMISIGHPACPSLPALQRTPVRSNAGPAQIR